MNKKTKKLLKFALIILIFALIFFIIIKSKTKKDLGNIILPTESHIITDEQLKENKEKEKNSGKVIIYWSMEDDKSLKTLKEFNTFYDKYSSKILFYAVNLNDNATKASAYLTNNNIQIPNNKQANITFNEIKENEIEEFPACVFVLKDGSLLAYVNNKETIQGNGTVTEFTSLDLNNDSIEAYLDIIAENY